jgi:phosphoglycolate phosphatase-like HAD superfamily hydrolase
MATTRLILFDIDGTLIHSGGAGSAAMNDTLETVAGVIDGFASVDFAGKTDIQIIREAFTNLGLDSAGSLADRFMELYPERLRPAVAKGLGHVKPGVKRLLQRLEEHDHCRLGLLTGNLETGARIKLEPYDLNRFFPFGAFGSDHADRNELLPVAVRRFEELRGIRAAFGDCIVVGDTPRDVECATRHGAACIAVATGPYSADVLQEAGADLVLPDLTDAERILQWIDERFPRGRGAFRP